MEKIKGTIENLKLKETKEGKPYLNFRVDGKWMSYFRGGEVMQSYLDGKIQNGDSVEVDAKQSGDFLNAEKITPVLGTASELPQANIKQLQEVTPAEKEDYAKMHMFCIEAVDTAIEGANVSAKFKESLRENAAALVNTQFIERNKERRSQRMRGG